MINIAPQYLVQKFIKLLSFKSALSILLMAMVALVASCSTSDPEDIATLSDWSDWSPATATSTVATIDQTRTRSCDITVNGNADTAVPTCSGDLTETRSIDNPDYVPNNAPVANPTSINADDRSEGEAIGTEVRSATKVQGYYTDADGDTLTYSITAGNDDDVFAIDMDSGEVTLAVVPDDAEVGSYALVIAASDGSLNATATLNVTIVNVNDVPVVSPTNINADDRSEGEVVGTVVRSATKVQSYYTDADGDTLTYSITAGNDAGVFAIDGNTGEVTLAVMLDDAQVGSYALVIAASDGVASATATLNVTVTNSNDAPVASPLVINADDRDEGEAIGTVVRSASQVQGYYSDADGDVLSYSITAGNDAVIFAINATSGEVSLAVVPDDADLGDYALVIAASDGSLSATATMNITIVNVNDAPVASPLVINAQNRSEGDVVGTVVRSASQVQGYYSDADGDVLSYSITAGNDAVIFAINATSGEVSLAVMPDDADLGDYALVIAASDGSLSATATMNVDIVNVNDAPVASPLVINADDRDEGEAIGTVVRSASQVQGYYSDADGDTLTYSITAGNDEGVFAIDIDSGEVTLAVVPDDADLGDYALVIAAFDGSLSATATMNITIVNVNDAPVASPLVINAQNRSEGDVVGTVVRSASQVQGYYSDADGDVLSYSITAGNGAAIFAINATSGEVSLAVVPDDAEVGELRT